MSKAAAPYKYYAPISAKEAKQAVGVLRYAKDYAYLQGHKTRSVLFADRTELTFGGHI